MFQPSEQWKPAMTSILMCQSRVCCLLWPHGWSSPIEHRSWVQYQSLVLCYCHLSQWGAMPCNISVTSKPSHKYLLRICDNHCNAQTEECVIIQLYNHSLLFHVASSQYTYSLLWCCNFNTMKILHLITVCRNPCGVIPRGKANNSLD